MLMRQVASLEVQMKNDWTLSGGEQGGFQSRSKSLKERAEQFAERRPEAAIRP
jgi:hypothetical protein